MVRINKMSHSIFLVIRFSIGLWTLMTAVGRKTFEIYVDEMKKMVRFNFCLKFRHYFQLIAEMS